MVKDRYSIETKNSTLKTFLFQHCHKIRAEATQIAQNDSKAQEACCSEKSRSLINPQTNGIALANLRSRRHKLVHGVVDLQCVIFLEKKSSHQCFLYSSNNGPSLTKSNLTKIKTELTTPPRDWDICRIGTKDKITQKCQLLGVEDPYLRRNWLPTTTFAAVINLYIRNAGRH